MGKKTNDHEVGSSRVVKDENPRMGVPLISSVAQMFYENWTLCDC
jgi:hypothetical protein